MRNMLFLPLLFLFSHAFSQDEEIKPLLNLTRDKLIFDITVDNWQGIPEGIQTRLWSPGISAAFFNDVKFGESLFGFAFGIGVSSHNVHHNGVFNEIQSTDTTPSFTSFVPKTKTFKKNKLATNYIEIPFEIRFRTKGDNPFRFYPGFKFGYLFDIHTKTIDNTGKWKFYTFPNADSIRYGLTGRIGIGQINFFGFYALNSIFRSNRGPGLIPWSAGLSLIIL